MITDADTSDKHERFAAFRLGFRDGIRGGVAKDLSKSREAVMLAYDRGYTRGRDVMHVELIRECERLDYDPLMSILRASDDAAPHRTEVCGRCDGLGWSPSKPGARCRACVRTFEMRKAAPAFRWLASAMAYWSPTASQWEGERR